MADSQTYDPSRALIAAIVLSAITARDVSFINSPYFDSLIEMAGMKLSADECRAALRKQGVLP